MRAQNRIDFTDACDENNRSRFQLIADGLHEYIPIGRDFESFTHDAEQLFARFLLLHFDVFFDVASLFEEADHHVIQIEHLESQCFISFLAVLDQVRDCLADNQFVNCIIIKDVEADFAAQAFFAREVRFQDDFLQIVQSFDNLFHSNSPNMISTMGLMPFFRRYSPTLWLIKGRLT